jgi:hypothetical protein
MVSKTVNGRDEQAVVWDFYKPRHTHAWNMLVLSWRHLDQIDDLTDLDFTTEYHWENFILRLWLYRTTVMTLTRLVSIEGEARQAVQKFDHAFCNDGKNQLKALRDMIEHFDDYAVGVGRGPAKRDSDLDPWRSFTRDQYERGRFCLERASSYSAAIELRSDATRASAAFISWYKGEEAADERNRP